MRRTPGEARTSTAAGARRRSKARPTRPKTTPWWPAPFTTGGRWSPPAPTTRAVRRRSRALQPLVVDDLVDRPQHRRHPRLRPGNGPSGLGDRRKGPAPHRVLADANRPASGSRRGAGRWRCCWPTVPGRMPLSATLSSDGEFVFAVEDLGIGMAGLMALPADAGLPATTTGSWPTT